MKVCSQQSKMLSSSPDFQHDSFQIKHDDKFFSRLLSKERSKASPSFRVYHGDVSGAVPFMWETRPGTPKCTFSDNSLPPLTPPPSYYSNNNSKSLKKHSRSKVLSTLLMKINHKKPHMASSPSSSSSQSTLSWSSSSHSSPVSGPNSTPSNCKRRRFSSWGSSSFDHDKVDDHEEVSDGSRTPGLCFGIRRSQGGFSVVVVKKALLSIVGRASA